MARSRRLDDDIATRPDAGPRAVSAPPGLTPAERRLQACQRLAGNAATAAVVRSARRGRPGHPPATATAVQGNWLAATARKLFGTGPRPRQPVTVEPIGTARYFRPGGCIFEVNFSLAQPAANDGWVIQEVTTDTALTMKSGRKQRAQSHFWEAWEIRRGQRRPTAAEGYDDQYWVPRQTAATGGFDKTDGRVTFYEGPLPSSFKTGNRKTAAGDLPSSTSRPSFWDGSGARHDLILDWEHSDRDSTWTIDTAPGTAAEDATGPPARRRQ